jgi:hypothetical protein
MATWRGEAAVRTSRPVVTVDRFAGLADGVDDLGVRRARPVVVLVGGADGMTDGDLALADRMLRGAVFPLIERLDAAVVDGGTDAGIMRAAGRARDAVRGRFPLVGVLLRDGVDHDVVAIEPYHTHVVLVPGSAWGDEAPWIAGVASVLASGCPSVTLVVNGGEITYDDIGHSIDARRPVVVVAGSGRTADAVAAAAAGRESNPRAERAAASPLTTVVDMGDLDAITAELESVLRA